MRGFALTKRRGTAVVIFALSIAPTAVNLVHMPIYTSNECQDTHVPLVWQTQFVLGLRGVIVPAVGCLENITATAQEMIMLVVHRLNRPFQPHR